MAGRSDKEIARDLRHFVADLVHAYDGRYTGGFDYRLDQKILEVLKRAREVEDDDGRGE